MVHDIDDGDAEVAAWEVFDRIREKVREIQDWDHDFAAPPFHELPSLYLELASHAAAALEVILTSLRTGDAVAQEQAARAAGALPDELMEQAVEALKVAATRPGPRRAAALTLIRRSLASLGETGAHLAGDEVIYEALCRDGSDEAVRLLREALRCERGRAKERAINVVSLKSSRPLLEELEDDLISLLHDSWRKIRLDAVRCLYKLEGDVAVQRAVLDAARGEIDLLVPGAAELVASHPDAVTLLEPLAERSLDEEFPYSKMSCIESIAAALHLDAARVACTPVVREALLRIIRREVPKDQYHRSTKIFAAAARAAGAFRDRELMIEVLRATRRKAFDRLLAVEQARKHALKMWRGAAQVELEGLVADDDAPEAEKKQARQILSELATG